MKNKYVFTTLCLLSLLVSSCVRNIESDHYVSGTIGEVSTTLSGRIQNVREVCVGKSDELEDNSTGLLTGGTAGGFLGHAVGRGHLLPTALGVAAGAIGGSLAERQIKNQRAFEYIVALDNGTLITVVQGRDVLFDINQPVYVIVSQNGRSRIIAQYSKF